LIGWCLPTLRMDLPYLVRWLTHQYHLEIPSQKHPEMMLSQFFKYFLIYSSPDIKSTITMYFHFYLAQCIFFCILYLVKILLTTSFSAHELMKCVIYFPII
jgi:hypothetical protein